MAVTNQAEQKVDVGIFNNRKLSEIEIRKEYLVKISNRLAALET